MTNESNEIQNPENQENMVSPKEAVKTTSAAAAHDDFDWDADEAGFESYSVTDRKQLEEQYTQTFNPVEEKQVVKGHVVAINDKDVVINIGFKSDDGQSLY